MSAEFWAILGVGASIVGVGMAILILGWCVFDSLRRDLDGLRVDVATVKERLARIEGWIAGRFREEAAHEA